MVLISDNYQGPCYIYPMYRVIEEIEEVMGDKPEIEADDLEKLTYMTQV